MPPFLPNVVVVNWVVFQLTCISQDFTLSSFDEQPMPYLPTQRNTVLGCTHSDWQDRVLSIR